MNSFEINKIFAAIVVTFLIIFGIGKISDYLFHVKQPDTKGYKVEINTEVSEAVSSAKSEVDISALLAMGSVEHGKKVFKKCAACHSIKEGGGNKIGPALYSVVGRAVGGVAALKVLKKNGVEVQEAYPGCCGMPFLEQADLPKVVEQAKKISKDLLEWINKGYKVVTLTASCGLMLKFEWPLLLPENENIKKLSSNVMDIDEYVVDISNNEGLVEGLQEIDGGVTVHHACHARAQNMGIKARDMLKLIPNVKIDVVERCAGHGGTFGVMKETHDLAIKVGRPTARQIKNKNNKYMASDCPLAGKHLKQLEADTNISNVEAAMKHKLGNHITLQNEAIQIGRDLLDSL
jgi:Fe-S oxidoreductase